jgi:hypothetical protein
MSTDLDYRAQAGTEPDPILACEWDVTRLFGLSDIGENGLRAGWAHPEHGHTWNDGPDATLVLAIDDGYGAATLCIEGEPYVLDAQPHQDITVYINGHRAAYWRLMKRAGRTLRVEVEPEWWVSRDDRPVLSIVFHLPDSVRPVDIGDGNDGRAVGFCFRTLLLTRAEPA